MRRPNWERRAFLSADYALDAAYARLIERASHATYGVEDTRTYVWIESVASSLVADGSRVRSVKELGDRGFVGSLPRYQEFTDVARALAQRRARFVEIAGNDEILLTAIAPGSGCLTRATGSCFSGRRCSPGGIIPALGSVARWWSCPPS